MVMIRVAKLREPCPESAERALFVSQAVAKFRIVADRRHRPEQATGPAPRVGEVEPLAPVTLSPDDPRYRPLVHEAEGSRYVLASEQIVDDARLTVQLDRRQVDSLLPAVTNRRSVRGEGTQRSPQLLDQLAGERQAVVVALEQFLQRPEATVTNTVRQADRTYMLAILRPGHARYPWLFWPLPFGLANRRR